MVKNVSPRWKLKPPTKKPAKKRKKLEAEQKSLTAPYDKALGEAVEKENALRRETLIAKRPQPENWTDEEKARMAKIDSAIKAINEKLKTDPKLVKIAARVKELQAIIDAPEYNIEALTGTWGRKNFKA